MANFNGMGPFNQGPLTGRGKGNCSPNSNIASKIGVGLGMGMELALVNKQFETKDND